MDQDKGKRKLAAVMFTDIEGYTALVSESEERALRFVRQHRESITRHTEKYGGEVIEFYGDGSLSLYNSALDAVHCAIDMQKDYRGEEINPVRIGIHLGDIVQRDGSIFGNGVNVASRIESIGVAGNILISERVEDELQNKEHINVKSLGKFEFKNVKKHLEIFAIDHPDLVVPTRSQLKGGKGKAVKSKFLWPTIVALLVISIVGYFLYPKLSGEAVANTIQEQRIAVPPFKNFTGDPALDFIGEMAAHLLTKELMKTENANVVAFYSQNDMDQFVSNENSDEFAKQMGALNVLEGSYNKITQDSLEFSSFIKKLSNGTVEYAFDKNQFSKDLPADGINQLSSNVKGYWDAKDASLISMPNFEAYKKYMQAREEHSLYNDSLARQLLLQSIQLDSSFLDSYFLLMTNYSSSSEYAEVDELINKIERSNSNLSNFEKNILLIEKSRINGENLKTYEVAMKDLSEHERDYFILTDYLIYSLEYVNSPQNTLDIYYKYEFDKLSLDQCDYCAESRKFAFAANLRLGQYAEAQKLLDEIPKKLYNGRFYSHSVKLMTRTKNLVGLEKVVNEAKDKLSEMNDDFIYYMAARELYISGQTDASKAYAKKIIDTKTENDYLLGWAYYFLDDYERAKEYFTKESEAYPSDNVTLSQLGVIYAKLGKAEIAEGIIKEIGDLKGNYDFGWTPYYQARVYAHLNQPEKALDLLQQAVNEGAKFYTNNVFDQDPDLQLFVSNDRFQRIIHPIAD